MTAFICVTCGTQFPDSDEPPASCPICLDPRQYVPETGQQWTTMAELRGSRHTEVRRDGELEGVGCEPAFAIGQRALLVPFGAQRVMWDCLTLLDDAGADAVEARGGLAGIAISHPHYYSGMVEWAQRFECPIHLHADDREWIMRPDPAVELWSGQFLDLGHGLTLVRCGGHFAGGTVLHWAGGAAGRGALLSGDIVQVIPDRAHVGFMYSYPNLIPLPEAAVRRIAVELSGFGFETIHGAWWDTLVRTDGSGVVARSAARYARALEDPRLI
jgi:hypothetical protein